MLGPPTAPLVWYGCYQKYAMILGLFLKSFQFQKLYLLSPTFQTKQELLIPQLVTHSKSSRAERG